jgi:hypothetical protein
MLVPLSCGDLSWEMLVEEMVCRQEEVDLLCQQIQLKTGSESHLVMCVGQ